MISTFDDLLGRIRTENLNVYRASLQRLREDVGQEAQIAQDYRGRLIYELLQNADDAMSSASCSTGAIVFVLDDEALWVANSGRPLDEADVRGLCGISASSKAAKSGKRRASIGHKGMGFKSILEICDAPEVYSTTGCFSFGPEKALQAVSALAGEGILDTVTRAPVTRFPWPIESSSNLWLELQQQGMQTAFRFPLRSKLTVEQRDGLARSLRELPITSLVFLKHLRRVEVSVLCRNNPYSSGWTTVRQKISDAKAHDVATLSNKGTYLVVLRPDAGESETFLVAHDADIAIDSYRGGLDEFTWEGVELTEVSVAARVRNGKPVALKPEWRKLHVFLPTGEPCPYNLLVNGAFGSNLSRQEIRVEADACNYNRLLLRNVASTLRDMLIPQLLCSGASVVEILKLLDRGVPIRLACTTGTAQALYEEVQAALHDFEFLSQENGTPNAIASCVVPPLVNNPEVGHAFRALLSEDASFQNRYFPVAALCASDIARVLVDHGAHELSPEGAVAVLADTDPVRSQLDVAGKLFVDPVLKVLEKLWLALPADARENLAREARCKPLFPVGIAKDGTAHRIVTIGMSCFYPPRSLHGTVPLDNLCFLMQEICWGDLKPKERNQELRQEMTTWQALFDVQEFKFPAVMRASVLPALDLERGTENKESRKPPNTLERIAAICQLAGRAPNHNAPLPYERLGSNRALFNLSRLDVPCRGATPEQFVWIPAYQAYLGSDWIGNNSVERILLVSQEAGIKDLPSIRFLAGPDAFIGLLAKYRGLRETPRTEDIDPGADEVGIEEDEDAALESDERTRWLNFLQWLGVNQALRPVHFHDVEDRASGWLKTANLQKPDGWIFKTVDQNVWLDYVTRIRKTLVDEGLDEGATPYFYRLHDLDHLVTFLKAASEDRSTKIGQALYEHLAKNWSVLERFSNVIIAQVQPGNVPTMRTKPQRAKDDELIDVGPDFWMMRLQMSPFCPTGHGPRYARQVWLPTLEIERRFGRRAKTGSYLLPALQVDPSLFKGKAKGLAQALGMREELSPATFNLEDARILLERLSALYTEGFTTGKDLRVELREVIRPAYRNLFELLSGKNQFLQQAIFGISPLSNAPLLAYDGHDAYRFVEDGQLYYIDRRDTRERLQSEATIWSFVIEALPAARSPIVELFGVNVLEQSLRWAPKPGDPALSSEDLELLKSKLRDLAPYLLARIATDRTDEKLAKQDAQRLRRFVECLEAVANLTLGCELAGQKLNLSNVNRDMFVDLESDKSPQAYVVWGEQFWPPGPQEAEALANALCEVFGAGYFESFLAFIQARATVDCKRLLQRAGAPLDIEERQALFLSEDTGVMSGDLSDSVNASNDFKTALACGVIEQQQATLSVDEVQQQPFADVRRVPLFSPGQLLIDGEPVLVMGDAFPQFAKTRSLLNTPPTGKGMNTVGYQGYGGHTDLDALNRMGMWVAMSFERNRMRRSGLKNAEIFDHSNQALQPEALIFDVSTPDKIASARKFSTLFDASIRHICDNFSVSTEWPGFDVLTLDSRLAHHLDRLIELKSSGVASRVQEMSWNEWKSAGSSVLREHFYLYLVGNLRSDLEGSAPFVRTIRNPFEQLIAEVRIGHSMSRKVQLSVNLFKEAEHLNLSVCAEPSLTVPVENYLLDPVR